MSLGTPFNMRSTTLKHLRGGIWGYAGFLAAIRDPKHPEHEAMLEWVGGEFDPDAFDLDEINTELQHLK